MSLRNLAAVGAVLALVPVAPGAASAATFTVNTAADGQVAGGCETAPACSLRDAVRAASTSPDPGDTVEIPPGSYLLTEGELTVPGGISGLVTIHGAGARSTIIDGEKASRVFRLGGEEVTIEGVTVTGGAATEFGGEELSGDGGGILVVSSKKVNIVGSTIVGNEAQQNGGGVSAPPEGGSVTELNVAGSTIAANRVGGGVAEGFGGGLYALGDVSIVNSTFNANSAESTAGSVQGGGVLIGIDIGVTDPTSASILNSTIAGNSVATGGVGGGLSIYNPTPGTVTALSVKNTVVAGNTAAGAPSDCGTVALITSSNNLSGDASCQFTDAGSKQNADPLLGPLQNNGGPTDTMSLAAGSPALDAGTNAGCPATDQRGVSRPQGGACDIGAYEREAAAAAPAATAAADLKLTLKAKPKRPKPGAKLAFKLRVADNGPDTATGVVVSGTVPALARKIRGKKVNGKRPCKLGKAKRGKRKLTCRLGSLASGKSRAVRILVRPGAEVRKLRASARVRSGVADPNPKDNRAKAVARVAARR